MVAVAVFLASQVTWVKGKRAHYQSTPGTRFRGYCRDCGTPLTLEAEWKGNDLVEFQISALDEPKQFVPTFHAFYGERIPWLEAWDDLPKYDAMPPE